jgi:CYTH domain-containing protein
METELEYRDEEVILPSFIKILREVTGDRSYSNAGMAESFPPEIITE